MTTELPQVTVVVPILNEAEYLPALVQALSAQRGLCFEVVLVDGGSTDGSLATAVRDAAVLGLELRVVVSPRGRARQMNAGAATARAPELLFLHADSGLPDPETLARGLAHLEQERVQRGHHRVAGHFGLHFERASTCPSRAYYFYEAKTRLNRPDCIRGDQGFLLGAGFFRELGGFDDNHPYMEDSRLAARIGAVGSWLALPGVLHTSARRFETEGFRQRQILNALLCDFDHIGMHGFFPVAAEAYREQGDSGELDLIPFFRLAHQVAKAEGWWRWLGYWSDTGRYVAGNAWQLAFALDCRANWRDGWAPGEGPRLWLARYRRWLRWLVDSRAGGVVAALLTAGWIYGSLAFSGPTGRSEQRF